MKTINLENNLNVDLFSKLNTFTLNAFFSKMLSTSAVTKDCPVIIGGNCPTNIISFNYLRKLSIIDAHNSGVTDLDN